MKLTISAADNCIFGICHQYAGPCLTKKIEQFADPVDGLKTNVMWHWHMEVAVYKNNGVP